MPKRSQTGLGSAGTYEELPPPVPLASHVACVWWRDSSPGRVLPDGCVDLVWTGADLLLAGPATRAVVPEASPREPKVGVRFRVGAAGAALGLPAAELLDQSPAVRDVWAGGDELTRRVGEASGLQERVTVMAAAVRGRLQEAPMVDPLVRAAVLDLARPGARVGSLARRLAISERELRRRFRTAVGYSPATLARVLRLQRFLALSAAGGGLAGVAAAAGYADQPHMTRDCRDLAGLAPAALLSTGAGPAGERLIPT